MKKLLILSVIALGVGAFTAPVMADAIVVGPNGVGFHHHHHHDRNWDRGGIYRTRDHGDHDGDHSHHADRGE